MKFELSVGGMTCGGCEIHVEKSVLKINGIIKAKALHSSGKLTIDTDETFSSDDSDQLLDLINSRISEAGYTFNGKYVKTPATFSVKQWVGIVIIMAALYLFVRETGIMSRLPVIESSMGYGLIFIIGLMTSVHCIGMCGGINLSVSISGVKDGNSSFKRAVPALLYNAGRVVSYTVIGGMVGALGSVISISGSMQGIIVGLAGIFMLFMGVQMLGLLPGIEKVIPRLPKGISSRILNSGSGRGPFIVGLLNGFMPCGPLQSVQIYALGTGSALSGALSMFLFSLGTVPLMLGFGSISSILPVRFHGKILKVSALLVLILGGGMVLRGMSLNGLSIMGSNSFNIRAENVRIAEINEDRQYVRTIMHGDEYEPFIVQAGIPVVWTIYADAEDLNGCNNPLTVPEYGIRFQMEPGENIIEFTPPETTGTITYTCWMGMITSGIKVVDDLKNIDASLLDDAAALAAASEEGCGGGSGGSCCSGGGEGENSLGDSFSLDMPEINDKSIGLSQIIDGIQIVEVSVDENGFEPAIVIMERGLETNWLINGQELNEQNYRISFPSYGNRGVEIIEGINTLQIIPDFDFAYLSWKGDFGGYVKVVDDLNSADVNMIKDEIRAYNNQNNY